MRGSLPPRGEGPGRGRRCAALLVLLLVLSACGFRPLYAEGESAPVDELRRIAVAVIPDRAGQMLRTELELLLDPRGTGGPENYRLHVDLDARRADVAIRKDETATRIDLMLKANYRLTRLADGKPIKTGSVRTINSYNVVASDFATAAGEDDALDAAIRNVALQLQTQLAIFFRRRAEDLATTKP